MTDDRSLERAARMWLEEGPNFAPDRAVEAALTRIETTRQERAPVLPWRFPTMHPIVRYAAAAVLAVVAVGGALYLLGDGFGGIGAPTGPSESVVASIEATPTPTPAPTPIDSTAWESFTSSQYSFEIRHPSDWSVRPATESWGLESTDTFQPDTSSVDTFTAPDETIRLSAWSVDVEPGTTLQQFVEAFCERNTRPCDGLADRLESAYAEERDRHPGVLIEFDEDIETFFPLWYDATLGPVWTQPAPSDVTTIYIVASWRPAESFNSRELVEAFSMSMCLGCTGDSAATPSPSP